MGLSGSPREEGDLVLHCDSAILETGVLAPLISCSDWHT